MIHNYVPVTDPPWALPLTHSYFKVLPPRVRRLTFVAVVMFFVVTALVMADHTRVSDIYPPEKLAFSLLADTFVETSSGILSVLCVLLRQPSSLANHGHGIFP